MNSEAPDVRGSVGPNAGPQCYTMAQRARSFNTAAREWGSDMDLVPCVDACHSRIEGPPKRLGGGRPEPG